MNPLTDNLNTCFRVDIKKNYNFVGLLVLKKIHSLCV
jgi:hypothetical protein